MSEDNNESKSDENPLSILEEPINQIIELVEKLPDRYKEKTYEKLLEKIILGEKIGLKKIEQKTVIGDEQALDSDIEFKLPIEVRAFLRQFSISEEKINDLFLITGRKEIARIYKLKTTKASEAQIQLSVLTALENTLNGKSKFEFNIEEIRTRCEEEKCYDSKNFSTNFKNKKRLFNDLKDTEHVTLSPLGKEFLAEVLNEL